MREGGGLQLPGYQGLFGIIVAAGVGLGEKGQWGCADCVFCSLSEAAEMLPTWDVVPKSL